MLNAKEESPRTRFPFLGLHFHPVTMSQALRQLEQFIRSGDTHTVFTPTAESIVMAHEDPAFQSFYEGVDLLTVDSHVVCYAARAFGCAVPEPVSGARLMLTFIERAQDKGYRIFLLGATDRILTKTAEKLREQFPQLQLVGTQHGYFSDDAPVLRAIAESAPDVLFIGMSSPLKERFVARNLSQLQVPVAVGVGGTFDIIAGKYKLAPSWISKVGMEWLYRLVQEPRRLWKRYLMTNTKFLWLLVQRAWKGRSNA